MATVTGDYAIDWSGASSANPVVLPDELSFLNSTSYQVTAGSPGRVRPASYTSESWQYINVAAHTETTQTLRAKIEIFAVAVSDPDGVSLLDSSGNGYVSYINGSTAYLRNWVAFADNSQLSAPVGEQSDYAGHPLVMEWNPTTGALLVTLNGETLFSLTDTTYEGTDYLRPGFCSSYRNNNNGGVVSFAADGHLSVSSPTPTSFSTDDSFPSGETAAVVGTNLDTVTAATLDGVNVFSGFTDTDGTNGTQVTPSLSDTQQSNFPAYGAIDYILSDGVTPGTLSVTHVAPTGKQYVTLAGTLNTTASESLIPHETGVSVVAGFQMIVDSNATGGAAPAIDISAADGTFSFTYVEGTTYTFDFQFLDVSTNTLYASGTVTVIDGLIVLNLSGTASSTCSASGELLKLLALAGDSAGAGVATGDLTKYLTLSGSVDSQSDTVADLIKLIPLSGSVASVGSVGGDLLLTLELSGSADGVADASGTINLRVELGGSTESVGSVTGDLLLTIELAGSADSVGSTEGNLTISGIAELSGLAQASGNAFAELLRDVILSGDASGFSSVSGDLIISELVELAGVATGQSSTTAILNLLLNLSGDIDGLSDAQGNLRIVSLSTVRGIKRLQYLGNRRSLSFSNQKSLTYIN